MKFTIELIEDPETGELVLPLTPEIIEELGWVEGDTLIWTKDGESVVVTKKNKT
jgi:formylmethanofuran dehydrogenase subunit D